MREGAKGVCVCTGVVDSGEGGCYLILSFCKL